MVASKITTNDDVKPLSQPCLTGFTMPELVVLPRPKPAQQIKQEAILHVETVFLKYAAAAAALENQWEIAAAAATGRKSRSKVTHPDTFFLNAYDRASGELRTAVAEALKRNVSAVDLIMAMADARIENEEEGEE